MRTKTVEVQGSTRATTFALNLLVKRRWFQCEPVIRGVPAKWWAFTIEDDNAITLPRPGPAVTYPGANLPPVRDREKHMPAGVVRRR